MVVIWKMSCKKCILWAKTSNQVFVNSYYFSFQDMQSFDEFIDSEINNSHINGLHLFLDRFEWFCLQISKFFSSFIQGIVIED